MKYHGGKSRLATGIVDAMMSALETTDLYVEPFVGGASVLVEVRKRFPTMRAIASDICPDLILFWQAVQAGWVPPTTLTYEEYQQLRYDPVPSAMRAFAGFTCSFGARFFEGYARSGDTNFAQSGSESTMRKSPHINDVNFICADFTELRLKGQAVIYCDPPYQSTKPYSRMPKWEPDRFWEQVDKWKAEGHTVFVSEFDTPPGYEVVWQKDRAISAGLKVGKNSRTWKTDRLIKV